MYIGRSLHFVELCGLQTLVLCTNAVRGLHKADGWVEGWMNGLVDGLMDD